MKTIFTKQHFTIGLVCLLIGFMIAILFNTNYQTTERDTRDTWEIRTALLEEQKVQQNLYTEIAEAENTLREYREQTEHQQIESLQNSIQQLREQAGLTEKQGQGLIIKLEPMFLDDDYQEYPEINAELLQLFINELSAAGATEMAIENQRITNITPIRDVNGNIYVNNTSIGDLPTEIYVLTNNSEEIVNHIEVSEIGDYFALENVTMSISKQSDIVLPEYDDLIDLQDVDIVDVPEEGES
ncbi:Uncharacterized conserved protein YlxW, UPF0749 family [Gracilibacillus orientalis]|uniref:Uncharacterized conserved protein YlxW, UPF0749 family n=1 Tax=Gracilibacillus orientalis TaxID=334253 RepID=A0A1I4M9V2_9BACI|nr:DUF881 domain-containing protein [Gracilibacillus orientalis]SFL99930.1 Uncharacterized conserved protein YlxW, UPF0749 family [Gracilibacillus orientalis]